MSQEKKQQLSKEELARRISGSVAARSNDEIRQREQARKHAQDYPEYAARRQTMGNPYTEEPGGGFPQYRPEAVRQTSREQASAGRGTSAKKKSAAAARRRSVENERRRNAQARKRIISAAVTLLILCSAAGAGGIFWYSRGKSMYDGLFLDNTYINGTNVGGLTPEQAVDEIRKSSDTPDMIVLTKPDGTDVKITLKSIGGSDNIEENVKNFFNDQDHSGWLKAKSNDSVYSFTVTFDFDEKAFYEEVDRKIVKPKSDDKSENAYIERTSSGFQIVPEVIGTNVDDDKVQALYDYIDGFIERGSYAIDLKNCNCYQLPKVTESALREELAALNALYDVTFTFDFGYTKEVLEGSRCINWITFENDNPLEGFTVDEDKVMDYVEELGEKYDTFGKDRTFHSTTRGDITVEQGEGDYGWWIDRTKTATLLTELVHDGISATVTPYYYKNPSTEYEYTCTAERTKESDIGSTYCEVDLEKQHFWYYKDGIKTYDCDIVSGKATADRNTPGGVYKIWYKEKNKVLTGSTASGETWRTPVTYWNNISTFGIGLHDANWQPSFGGSQYVYGGSHGCINMPVSAAEYVFNNIEIGTPVIMYW